jgi:AraC family transcriptional regulator
MGRTQLLTLPSGTVEDVSGTVAGRKLSAEDFSPEFQIALPYRGVFTWHVCCDDVVADPNQILFVTGGEPFRVSGPRTGRYAELVLTPSFAVLSQLTERTGFAPRHHPLFRARSCRATAALQRASAHLRHWSTTRGFCDPLAAEEAMLRVLRVALEMEPTEVGPSIATRRVIRRTKEYLDVAFTRRLLLRDIAGAVGTSPTYLTDVFARFEGISLRRYITQLRLGRALVDLRSADDLTSLALDLGFSSHSHFTLAFRRAFGCTPSQFRTTIRNGQHRQEPLAGRLSNES